MDRVDSLANDYGRLFLRMHRLLNRRMAEAGASLSRTKLLMFIQARQAVRAADIAEFFGYAPRSVTDAIDGLERDGLVRREADRRDRRAKWISISNEAEPVARFCRQALGRGRTTRGARVGTCIVSNHSATRIELLPPRPDLS